MPGIQVSPLKTLTPEDARSLAGLVRQLSSTAPALSAEDLARILAAPSTTILVARIDEAIVGMTTVAVIRVATGTRASIEDVVVAETHRGHGIGEALVREAIATAQSQGARKVDLTSRPSREAANHMYKKLGFTLRETNVYRYDLA